MDSVQPVSRIGGGNVEKIQLDVSHRPPSVLYDQLEGQLDAESKWWGKVENVNHLWEKKTYDKFIYTKI